MIKYKKIFFSPLSPILNKSFFLILLFLSANFFSQILSSRLEKNTLSLGEPTKLVIKIDQLHGQKVVNENPKPILPHHFEILSDSIANNGDTLERSITFAIYDEGDFTLPELSFLVGDKTLKTISYEVKVRNPVSENQEIQDIMNNKEMGLGLWEYWELYKWYILLALAITGVLWAAYFIIKYAKKTGNTPEEYTNKTMKDLELLKKKQYIEKNDFRSFYVELLDICRAFVTKQYAIPAEVLLTEDLLEQLHINNTISLENEKIVAAVFTRGDQVKFAKTFPDQDQMTKDFNDIREFVKNSIKDIEFENLRKNG